MPFMWTKGFGGKHAGKLDLLLDCSPSIRLTLHVLGGGVIVDKHGPRRAPFRFSLGRFNCFR
jgi:hypothetical protein